MAREPVDIERVLTVAEQIVDDSGWDELTMAAVAHALHVKVPSLYSHVSGLAEIRARLQARTMVALGADLQEAAMGRTRADAVRALCGAYRAFALRHPNRYTAIMRASVDPQMQREASVGADRAVRASLRSFGFDEDAVFGFELALQATAHGFLSLELNGLLAFARDPLESERLYFESIERIIDALEHRATAPIT